MNAPAKLPLDGSYSSPGPTSGAAVEGETFTHSSQYLRLFGSLPPAQAIVCTDLHLSPGTGAELGSPPASFCDPSQAASHPLFSLLAEMGHPSAASLASIAALRARHIVNGHLPEADAAHGWVHFKRLADEAYRAAIGARSAEARRKRLITAIAILVAQLDAEDFLAAQQESTCHE